MSKSPCCCLQISFNHGVAECPLQFGDENFLLWKMVLHTEWRWISNAAGDFPCPFPSGHTKAMSRWWECLRQGSQMKYGRLLGISGVIAIQSMLHERVAPKPPNSHATVTQVARVEHAEINIPSPAVSLSPILSSSACSHSVLFFIGVGVSSAVPRSLSMSFRTGMIVCPHRVWVSSSSPPYSVIHGSRASLGAILKGNLDSMLLRRSGQVLPYDCIKCQLLSLSNLPFSLDLQLSRYYSISLCSRHLGGCLPWIHTRQQRQPLKHTYILQTDDTVFMYLDIYIYIPVPLPIHIHV